MEFSVQSKTTTKNFALQTQESSGILKKTILSKNMKSSRLRLLFAQNHPGLEMHMQLLIAEDSSALLLLFIDCLSEIKLSRV